MLYGGDFVTMKFNKKDESVVLGFARCGTMTYTHMKELGYSDSRIKNRSCGEQKLFERLGTDAKSGDVVYRLTEIGKDEAVRLGIPRDEIYRPQGKLDTMNFEHDRKLADVYCSISQEERDTWRTEEQYKREIEQVREHIRKEQPDRSEEIKNTKMTAFDGGYTNAEGVICHVEVITQNYKGEMEASKEASADMLGGSYCSFEA